MMPLSAAQAFDLGIEADAVFLHGETNDGGDLPLKLEFKGALFRHLVKLNRFGIEVQGGFVDRETTTQVLDSANSVSTGIQSTNLRIAGHYMFDDIGLRIGLGLVIPLANQSHVDESRGIVIPNPVGPTAAAYGDRDLWLFTPGRLGILIPVQFDTEFLNLIRFELSATPFVLIPVEEGETLPVGLRLPDPPLIAGLQAHVESAIALALFGPVGFEAGARLSQVLYYRGEISAPDGPVEGVFDSEIVAQLAFEPFLGITAGPAAVRVRLNINLDEPAGPSFQDDNFYGLQLQGIVRADLL